MRNRGRISIVLILLTLALLVTSGAALAKGEPVADDPFADAITLPWDDGSYQVAVTMEGGSGKASVTSPTEISVEGGKAVARIEWSSPNYDYMVVAGKTYLPINEDGNSVFLIPLLAVDEPFDVIGDTTAMSKPHEVTYQLTFDASSAVATGDGEEGASSPLPAIAGCVAAAGAGAAVLLARCKHDCCD